MSLIKAKVSMVLGQHDRAAKYFHAYLNGESCTPLSQEELGLLSNAYDNVARDKRNRIMQLDDYVQCAGEHEKEHVSSMLDEMRTELIAICADVVDLVDRKLLQNVEISTRERVSVYKIKGDFLRYMWEANFEKETCEQAITAYYEAMGMCLWNYEPTDVFLLQVAMNYTVHLINANYTDLAITILNSVIKNAQQDQEKNDPTNNPFVELLLIDLNENLVKFQKIADQKCEERLEHDVNEHLPEMINFEEMMTVPDSVISRRYG